MTANSLQLDKLTHEKIQKLCAAGDELAGAKQYSEAVVEYAKAWLFVPDPKNEWEAATWILAALADVYFLAGQNVSAREALGLAMTCPGAIGNPFIHMRYGQVLYDAGELDAAADELMRAYMGAGSDIFVTEDPRYLVFLKTRAKL